MTEKKKRLSEIVYSPEPVIRHPRRLLHAMASDITASRELAWRLLVRNISAHYRQTVLGYLWAILPPLFTTAVWVFLASQRIIDVGETRMPYLVFVLTGTLLWQVFVDALNSPIKLVGESKAMLAKINFPREALVLAGLGEVLFNFVVRLILLVVVFLWYGISVPATALFAPLGVLFLVGAGLTVGLLLTPLAMLYHDIGRGVAICTQFWFFLTPVIYPLPQAGPGAVLAGVNPVTPLLTTTRDWLTTGSSGLLPGFWMVAAGSVALLLCGWVLYRLAMPHLIARMSA